MCKRNAKKSAIIRFFLLTLHDLEVITHIFNINTFVRQFVYINVSYTRKYRPNMEFIINKVEQLSWIDNLPFKSVFFLNSVHWVNPITDLISFPFVYFYYRYEYWINDK